MKAKLVKFEDDGTICKNDINYLRKHPECGIPFVQDKPFKPHNPKYKFRPHDRNFSIDILDRTIPGIPDIPPAPPFGQPPKIGEAVGAPPYTNEYLPQDYTNYNQSGRRLIGEHLEYDRNGGYGRLPIANAETDIPFPVPRIGNNNYSHETPERPTRPVGEVELEDFGAGVGITNQEPTPIRQTRIRPLPDPRDTEFDLPDIPLPEELNITDLPPDIKEQILQVLNEGGEKTRLERVKKSLENTIDELNEEIQRSRRAGDSMLLRQRRNFKLSSLKSIEKYLNKIIQRENLTRKILEEGRPNVLKPRGMTDEELIDAQIEQLSRNLSQQEAKQVEQSIRSKGKGKAKVKPTEQEMFPIQPIDEYKVVADEVEKILKSGEDTLTIRQKEKLVREMESRGISRQRTEEILEEAQFYDPALERAVGMSSRGEVERISRLIRGGLRSIPTRDTNLLPERQESIELREDTPLTRGRTDIATGRGRIEKVYDRTAARLPEELRTLAGSVKRNTQNFNENIRTKSLEAIQSIKSTSNRVFGQKYTSITEEAQQIRGLQEIGTESGTIIDAPEGNINIRQPATEDITGVRPNDLQALDFDPLGADYQETFVGVGGTRPTLTYGERLQRVRAGAFSEEAGVAGAGAVGGVLIGFGVSELMQQAGVHNKYAIAATAGGAGGAGARILTMAGSRALTRGAGTAVAETATYTAVRAGTSLLRGAAEGAVVGLALMPVDMLLNDYFVNQGMSHTESNLTSGGIVGGTATALTTIGLAALGAAPETLGASLIAGGLAMTATSIIGFFTGQDQDRKEREAKEKAEKARTHLNTTSAARRLLLESLPNYGYDFNKALAAFTNKDTLGIDDDTWNTFTKNTNSMFIPRPSNTPPQTPTSGEPPTGEQKKINDLFSKYITHKLINRVCTNGGCEELRRHDQGALTEDEVNFLNDKTGSTWKGQADMQVEMSVQELNYTRQRIGDAQMEMLNAWNNEQKIANQLDPYVVETASLDPTFRQRYDLALKLDAEQRVVDAYQDNQTKIEQLPKNIRTMANTDPEFDNMIHQYYNSMETTAGQLSISVSQLVELQSLSGEAQKDKYEEFQFDNIKQDPVVVAEAQEIAKEEDQVREAQFYDIDQAFLETDPTAINTWHPTDSQILQAHSAGMNLNEYVEYMHQLAMGEAGDYSKLPKYTDEQLRASGLLDYSHFQDELQMAGYRKDLYLYDPETRQFTLNPNVSNSAIPSTQETFISKYTPRYLLQARQEYADMIHGLNEKNQNEVDNYNANLMKELSSYGKHYDSIVADINNQRLYEGRRDLLFYDVGKMYNQNKIEFSALSDKLKDAPTTTNVISQDAATAKQFNKAEQGEDSKILQQKFREANPNLDPNINFTDTQINTLNQGGEVTVNNQVFATA